MIKTSKVAPLHLPKISKPKFISSTHRTDSLLESGLEEENDLAQVEQLDHWTARNYQTTKSRKGQKIVPSVYKKQSLYREFHPQKQKTIVMSQSGWLMEPKLYLLRLDSQLKKVSDIKYDSMYKNIEYCSSFYEHFYRDIFRFLDKYIETITAKISSQDELVKKKRLDHIKSMETLHSSALTYKINISQVRENIQIIQEDVQMLKTVLDQLQQARIKVLKHSLMIGYDVREEGLLWIIRQLGFFPENSEFPPFLNQKEITYLKNKFQKEQQQRQPSEQIFSSLGKNSLQLYEIVTRKKNRELSMIKEGDILKQLKVENNLYYSNKKYKYINEDVLKMAEAEFPKTKSTQYEIIYKETSKKLNKYCIDEIYKKNNHKKQKVVIDSRRQSMNTLKILSHFQAKISDYLRKANDSGKEFQSEEEKELDQIVRSLRYQSYQNDSKVDHSSRNVISILCCLLGSKKAKRLVEQELNHLF